MNKVPLAAQFGVFFGRQATRYDAPSNVWTAARNADFNESNVKWGLADHRLWYPTCVDQLRRKGNREPRFCHDTGLSLHM